MPDAARISFGTDEENARVIAAIEEWAATVVLERSQADSQALGINLDR
jgi:hypothetical protein